MSSNSKFLILVLIITFCISCTTTVVIDTSQLLPIKPSKININDNFDKESLNQAIENSLDYFNKLPNDKKFTYGKLEYSVSELKASMKLMQHLITTSNSKKIFFDKVNEQFFWWKSPGRKKDSRVLFTGYFEPQYQAALEPSGDFYIPAFAIPYDLKVLDLGVFRKNLLNRTIVYRLDEDKIIPYHSRKEIMEDDILEYKSEVLAWFRDSVDLFFLQIQGSGLIQTPQGELLRLGYAGSNGLEYSSIGKILIEEGTIPKEKMSMNAIREHLANNPEAVNDLLYQNNSYVFFRLLPIDEGPYGSLGVPVTATRSLATDYRLFPKGALAYIDASQPDCETDDTCQFHKPLNRFMVIQDTGGAIRGFGRADVFWGRGELAEKKAGYMQHLGDLYVLVAKKEYLKSFLTEDTLINELNEIKFDK